MNGNGQDTHANSATSQSDLDQRPMYFRLRPGGTLFELSSEQLQIVFPNHTATFTGVPVVKVVLALLTALGEGKEKRDAIWLAAQAVSDQVEFVGYVFSLLLSCQCLYPMLPESDQANLPSSMGDSTRLGDFFASIGGDPRATLNALRTMNVVLAAPSRFAGEAEKAFAEGGLSVNPIAIDTSSSCESAITRLTKAAGESNPLVVCWGFPYRLPFARIVNKEFTARKVKAIYSSCEGLEGRVGPFVIPGCSPCLECLNTRLLSNVDAYELKTEECFTLAPENPIPDPWPAHPVFARSVLAHLILEVSRIGLMLPPTTLGRFVEFSYRDAESRHRSIIKIPGCRVCRSSMPKRFAWNKAVPELPVVSPE